MEREGRDGGEGRPVKQAMLLTRDGNMIILPFGATPLGRGSLLGITDKRCSRNQALLTVAHTGVSFVKEGRNPSYLQRDANEKLQQEPMEMTTGQTYFLQSGDSFALIPSPNNEFTYTLHIEYGAADNHHQAKATTTTKKRKAAPAEEPSSVAEASSSSSSAASAGMWIKKPRHEDREEEEQQSAALNRQKGLPVCKYGEKCFRRNPDHFLQFSHPHLEEQTQPSVGNASSSSTTTTKDPTKAKELNIAYKGKEQSHKTTTKDVAITDPVPPIPSKTTSSTNKTTAKTTATAGAEPQTNTKSTKDSSETKRPTPAQESTSITASGKKKMLRIVPVDAKKKVVKLEAPAEEEEEEKKDQHKQPSKFLPHINTTISVSADPSKPLSHQHHRPPPLIKSTGGPSSEAEMPPQQVKRATDEPRATTHQQQKLSTNSAQPLPPLLSINFAKLEGARCLAFPPFCTAPFLRFDSGKACDLLLHSVTKFLDAHTGEDFTLILCIHPRLQQLYFDDGKEAEVDPFCFFSSQLKSITSRSEKLPRFLVQHADITQLKTQHSTPCCFVANEVNWRFSSKGSRVSQALAARCGPCLHNQHKGETAKLGHVYPVLLEGGPTPCSLYSEEEVRCVIQCRTPNLNPSKGDYVTTTGYSANQAQDILAQMYSQLFEYFYQQLQRSTTSE
ncbi:CUE domain containing protein [Balamuthia mandrillaris]